MTLCNSRHSALASKQPPARRYSFIDHDARRPDPGILAAFAHRLHLNAIAGGQVPAKVSAASLSVSDWEMLRGDAASYPLLRTRW
jgi:hypothetical protein